MSDTEIVQSVGRRKRSVARITMRPGSGQVSVNGKAIDDYFPIPRHRTLIDEPFQATETEGMYDILINVRGGGITGQAEASRLGVARALLAADEDHRVALRANGLLTRDPRVVERKKPGRPKARKRFQFSKR